jgi:hypothetical protein
MTPEGAGDSHSGGALPANVTPSLKRTGKGALKVVGGVTAVGALLLLAVAGVILLVGLLLFLGARWLGG